jgi:hypothetical protein
MRSGATGIQVATPRGKVKHRKHKRWNNVWLTPFPFGEQIRRLLSAFSSSPGNECGTHV